MSPANHTLLKSPIVKRVSPTLTRLPMIALSASAEPADIEAGRDAGFTDYVAKFQREALIASLHQCLAESIEA